MTISARSDHDAFHIGAKALIFDENGSILLLVRNHSEKKCYWDLPGGRVQKGETIEEALLRELKEEIGWDSPQAFHSLGMYPTAIRIGEETESVGLIFSVFACHLSSPFQPILSSEHSDFEWVDRFQASEKLKGIYPAELWLRQNWKKNPSWCRFRR